jgi:hypothetical protein
MKHLRLPREGSALRVHMPGGDELGVALAVNRLRRLIVALMEDGRQVELRVPANVLPKDNDAEAPRPEEVN